MQKVALINYGSGNLRSAEKALIRAADGYAAVTDWHLRRPPAAGEEAA